MSFIGWVILFFVGITIYSTAIHLAEIALNSYLMNDKKAKTYHEKNDNVEINYYEPYYPTLSSEVSKETIVSEDRKESVKENDIYEDIVMSPTYDGVTIDELKNQLTPDSADIVSSEDIEDELIDAHNKDAIEEAINSSIAA